MQIDPLTHIRRHDRVDWQALQDGTDQLLCRLADGGLGLVEFVGLLHRFGVEAVGIPDASGGEGGLAVGLGGELLVDRGRDTERLA